MSIQTPHRPLTESPSVAAESAPRKRSNVTRRAVLGGGLATLITAGTGGAWALNRFEVENASSTKSTAIASAEPAKAAATTTATSYKSDTAQIQITKVVTGSGNDTVTYYVADITVTDATIVRSAFANDQFGTNIIANPSEIAAQAGATRSGAAAMVSSSVRSNPASVCLGSP